MGTGRYFVAAVTLGACTTQPTVAHVAALASSDVHGQIYWYDANTPKLYVPLGAAPDGGCLELADDVVAALDGSPIPIETDYSGGAFYRGGPTTDPSTEKPACKDPVIYYFPIPSLEATPTSAFDLSLSDPTATLQVSIVNAFATRSVTLDGGGSLVPGTTATVRWAPMTDELAPPAKYNDIVLDCASVILPAMHTADGTLIQNGNAFSFAVPQTSQHAMLSCSLALEVHATIDACDFASCTMDLDLPGAGGGNGFGYYRFTLTI